MLACTPVEESIVKDIHDCLSTLYTDYINTRLAVRSSAADEDGSEASSAGQMETFLGVKGTTQILEAVRKCWASAYTYQAVEYRRQHGQAIKTSVGVVIQKMVLSDVAGVLFTADPVNGDTSVMTINANYGLGESVVSGKSDPDTIRIHREWKDKLTIINKHIGDKQSLITLKENGGIKEEGVETKYRAECCLTDEMILNLAQIAIMLEKYFGNSRDIEWAVKDDTVYLLQCRPITTAIQETEDDIIHEFDSAFSSDIECVTTGNIGEMMPGAVTPLTLSTFARSIDYALQNFNFGMGARRGISSVMCGIKSCSNHLFISLFQTECIVLSVGSTKKEMAELALLGEVLSIITVDKLLKYVGKEEGIFMKIINFLKMLRMISRGLRRTKEWEKRLPNYSIGVGCQDSISLYQDISAKLTDYTMVWDCTTNNSSRSSSWTSVLMSILTKGSQEWKSEHYGDLAILLAECEDVYSAEVPSAIQNLAKEINDTGLREKFLQISDLECVQVIYSGRHENLLASFKRFLSRHGHRCVRESEIYEKSWQVEPEKLIKVIKAILLSRSYKRPPKSTSSIADTINQMKTELPAFQRWIIKFLLPRTRKAVGDREWGKSLSIEMSEKFKKAYWILADLLVDEGRIPEADLMFYLTHAEIGTLLKTRSARLIMRASRRRKIHQKQMLYKFKKVVSGHPQLVEDGVEVSVSADFTWTGLPVSQGTAHGTARVVTTLQDAGNIQSGDILVVTCTDVGWSPYFPLINGLVTEVGGLISHGAVVAREYGIPCVVNICNATIQIKSGDQLYIDGKAGIVVRSCQ
ncbi:putative phosphoenolpyruvate synthase [Patella vulgata]|uniref:putative phosphoenolpyruvate synthase n=1 Tax=Patella vulgata TaxID=6465 RepID=UPI0021802C9E|nr:putative phosphoenolpyruvate synthase [Patella vulgata]